MRGLAGDLGTTAFGPMSLSAAAALCAGLTLASALSGRGDSLDLERPVSGTALVADPEAQGGRCVAVRIQEQPGATALSFRWTNAAPGLYRVSLPLRLHTRPGFKSELLRMRVAFGAGETPWLEYPISPAQLDGTAGAWTVLSRDVSLHEASPKNRLTVSWDFALHKVEKKGSTAFEIRLPSAPDLSAEDRPGADQATQELIGQIESDRPVPAASIEYPAALVGRPVIEPLVLTLAVDKVWPQKIHVYPGESNPVEVVVHNFTPRAVEAVVRLDVQTGLAESAPAGERSIRLPPNGTVATTFPWVAGDREYGHAAVATVSVDGRPVHSKAEYFSVSAPVWKTAIQGSGFLTWYGREKEFESHVDDNRRAYVNVEEAFSWQPSSWSNLNPTNEDWWSGQNGFHNSLSGLREWMDRSRRHGIKMITYSWASVSGKDGFDWGRRYPDILCREKGGLAPGVDLEDLRLSELVQRRPELWRYGSGLWQANFINLGLLRAIDHHATEVIRSSLNFGWDGIRFDYPPGWSPMGTEDVRREFDLMGVNELMRRLVPEYYDTTNAVWSGEAISIRNVRYFRHRFTTERGPQFAMSYNAGGLDRPGTNRNWWIEEMCRGGGQIMNEAIRTVSSLSNYMDVAWWHSESVRKAGGYSCVFMAERCPAALAAPYSAVFTFASGTHPYLDYGWLGPMPGAYSRFMTRYGEYCWDLALAPVAPEAAGVSVESRDPLLWERYVRQRQTNDVLQTVVHLVNPPEWNLAKAAVQPQVAWVRDVKVTKTCHSEPSVWLLTAEPEIAACLLPAERRDKGYAVTVPVVRLWSMLVWSERP